MIMMDEQTSCGVEGFGRGCHAGGQGDGLLELMASPGIMMVEPARSATGREAAGQSKQE